MNGTTETKRAAKNRRKQERRAASEAAALAANRVIGWRDIAADLLANAQVAESEYDGRMYRFCTACGNNNMSEKTGYSIIHDDDCDWERLRVEMAKPDATSPSVEPHSGSASLEAAGDARSVLIEIFEYAVLAKSRGLDPDGKRFTAAREALLAHLAAPASKDRALFISGAAGPLGEPEILGSPTDTQMVDWLAAWPHGQVSLVAPGAGGGNAAWDVLLEHRDSEIGISEVLGYEGSTLREAIRAAMSANTTKETE